MGGEEVPVPLVVDVDGTLVSDGLVAEVFARLVAASPLAVLSMAFWAAASIVDGGAMLRRRLARAAPPAPATLALNPIVMAEIAAARAAGREVWLISTADGRMVAPLVASVGAVGSLTSAGGTRLEGAARAAVLVDRFGAGGFDYIGSRWRDLAVWRYARRAVGVGLSDRLTRHVGALHREVRVLLGLRGCPRDYIRALRPHQWVKNVVVFAPLVAAHETSPALYLVAAGLFGALSVSASGAYVLNDLLDLPYDRLHERKRRRPIAAGRVGLVPAGFLGVALVGIGLGAAFGLATGAGLWVAAYVLVTFAYSLALKRRMFIDVVVLGLLFTIRSVAGAAVVGVPLTSWFVAFTFFIFLALAVLKRQSDLSAVRATGLTTLPGRAYTVEDSPVLAGLGAASGVAAVVVLALYIQSPEVQVLYGRPEVLWLADLLLVTWLGRMTLLAGRGAFDDDPVMFAVRDRTTWLVGIGIGLVAAFAAVL